MKTKHMWFVPLGLASLLVSATALLGQDESRFYRIVSPTTTVITAFSPDGMLTWSNATVGVTGCVQKATTLVGSSNWIDFAEYVATGITVVLPTADYMVIDLSAGPAASSYPITYLTTVPYGGWTDDYKTTKLVLRRISAGTFIMGSPGDELGREPFLPGSETQHQVTLTQPFYIGVFEVTQKQWERVKGDWPSYFTNTNCRDTRPVERLSYNNMRGSSAGTNWPATNTVDAGSFMGILRARTGKAFDLPTESQWEYAGRAGQPTALNSGFNITNTESDAHLSAVGRYWYNGGSGYTNQNGDTAVGTAKVGSFPANQWGLYDIHGNVWEWCLDWYGMYPGTADDPEGASTGLYRIYRGGGWNSGADLCRVAERGTSTPNGGGNGHVGFRVTLPPGQ